MDNFGLKIATTLGLFGSDSYRLVLFQTNPEGALKWHPRQATPYWDAHDGVVS